MSMYQVLCQRAEYSRIFSMPGFLISRIMQGLPIFVNMTVFWIRVEMQLGKCSEYSRIPIMPGFYICKRFTKFWIYLNMAE